MSNPFTFDDSDNESSINDFRLQVPSSSARLSVSPNRHLRRASNIDINDHDPRDDDDTNNTINHYNHTPNNSHLTVDPFSTAFDNSDDNIVENPNDYEHEHEHEHEPQHYNEHNHTMEYSSNDFLDDNESVYTKSNPIVNVYENYNDSNYSSNFLTTPNKPLYSHQSSNQYNYNANNTSPTPSNYELSNYYENNNNINNNINNPVINNTNNFGYYDEDDCYQRFERDFDEPELNQNELFQDDDFQNENNNILNDNANFADKGDNKVELIDGKYYSFDYPVPDQLLNKIPFNGAKQLTEFTHLRYHAITSDPKDYNEQNPIIRDYIENYPLRPNIYPIKRETELMIVCTMYNEDEILLGRTLKGVFKNIKNMYNLNENDNHPFGKQSWQKIVVVIVSDGKSKINERSKALLTLLGVFQEGIMQDYVNDDKVNAHLFEYTTTFGIGKFDYNRSDNSYKVPLVTEQTVPIQLMFLLKEENKQKINSHRWALNFLSPNLNPKVIVLLDVGTEPGPDSIYKLWKAFKNPKVGGACGEIRAMLGNHASVNDESSIWKKFFRLIYFKISDFGKCIINPLIAAQNFEYKMSNILDKPMESAFGFVTVLPGAFSAYRYEALKGQPLNAYFHGEDMKLNVDKPAGILESNMYLAEDRILCFELVTKSEKSYLLKYIHNSFAITDVPSQINEFINQRRRWLNGSFFAALYSILHFYRLLISKHSIGRKIFLIIEIIYQTINILLSWFSISIYFLVFRILTLNVKDVPFIGERIANILSIVFLWIYIGSIVLTFIISFGNKPNDAKYLYLLAFSLFATIVIYMTFCVVALTIESIKLIKADIGEYTTFTISVGLKYLRNAKFRDLTVSICSTYVLYLISSIIFFDVFHIFACIIQYLLLSPAYINVLGIFAFCNINDISWGTKGSLSVDHKVPPKKAEAKKDQDDAVKSEDDETVNEKVLLLSEKLENPENYFVQAQTLLSKGEVAKEKSELDIIKENIAKSERNYAMGRTYTVIIWLICNFILLVVILRTGGLEDYSNYVNGETTTLRKRNYWNDMNVANYFMTTILWLVAALALFRLIGCIYYRIDFWISERRFHKRSVV